MFRWSHRKFLPYYLSRLSTAISRRQSKPLFTWTFLRTIKLHVQKYQSLRDGIHEQKIAGSSEWLWKWLLATTVQKYSRTTSTVLNFTINSATRVMHTPKVNDRPFAAKSLGYHILLPHRYFTLPCLTVFLRSLCFCVLSLCFFFAMVFLDSSTICNLTGAPCTFSCPRRTTTWSSS